MNNYRQIVQEKVTKARFERESAYELYTRQSAIKSRVLSIIVSLSISVLLLILSRVLPAETIENIYSMGIYKWLAFTMMLITRPFGSVGEFIIILTIVAVPVSIGFLIKKLFKAKLDRPRMIIIFFLNWAFVGCLFLMMFCITAAPNYMRQPLTTALGVTVNKLPHETELIALTNKIALKANHLADKLDKEKASLQPLTVEEMRNESVRAYAKLAENRPALAEKLWLVQHTIPKTAMLSETMSDFGIMGVVTPFTLEANVNVHMKGYNVPVTMAHELGHLCGYMREEEAVWLSIAACRASDNLYMQYSGEITALLHCYNALSRVNPEASAKVFESLSKRIISDYKSSDDYFSRRNNITTQIGRNVNDAYLKANNQKSGINSYGMVVDILLADEKAPKTVNTSSSTVA